MARIRSIKPEFWSSEQVVECSLSARLLFVGMWNFCDDGGVHPASSKRLKMEVFPADDFTTEQVGVMVAELLDQGLVGEFEHEGVIYWFITGWKHQKIDRPNYRYPQPNSTNVRRSIDDQSPPEWKGGDVEGKGVEGKGRGAFAPALSQVVEFAKAHGRPECAEAFFNYWDGLNWMKKQQPIVHWDSEFRLWCGRQTRMDAEKAERAPPLNAKATGGPDYSAVNKIKKMATEHTG